MKVNSATYKKHYLWKWENCNLDGDGRFDIRIKGWDKRFYRKKMRLRYKKERIEE